MAFFKKKYLLIPLMSTLLFACGEDATQDDSPAEMEEEAAEAVEDVDGGDVVEITADVSIVVDGEEQEDLAQTLEVYEDTVLLEAMDEVYDLEGEDGFIMAIEGFEQDEDNNIFWTYSVNGEPSPVGAGEYQLQDNDQVEWRLEDVGS